MKFTLRSLRGVQQASITWHESASVPGVRYAVRRITLGQRITLMEQARELALRYEFLRAGDAADQLEAGLSDLLVRKLYLEWGLARLEGLHLDGQQVTPLTCVERAPEELANEIAASIQAELGLSEEERKNC